MARLRNRDRKYIRFCNSKTFTITFLNSFQKRCKFYHHRYPTPWIQHKCAVVDNNVVLCCRSLKAKWQERSELISKMERQVVEVRDKFQEKELKLTEERDKALAAGK